MAMLVTAIAYLVGFVLLIGILFVLAEGSLRRQRGSKLRRGRRERLAVGRIFAMFGREGGSEG
jgi:hypothetical protein